MINKKKFILVFLLLITFVILNVFNLTPLARLSTYLAVVLSTVGHILFISKGEIYPKQFRSWYILSIFLMLLSIFTCNIYYGQSIFSGIVATINFYNVGSVSLFFYLVKRYQISISELFAIFIKAGWILWIFTIVMGISGFVFVNESELTGKVIEVDAGKLSKAYLNLIAIYWFSKFLFKNKNIYLLYSLLFFGSNHIVEIQRFAFLLAILILCVGVLKRAKTKASMKFVITALFSVFFILLFAFGTSKGVSIVDKFYEAAKVFIEDDAKNINDSSAAARIYETEFALDKFKEHPVFGNGYYRASEAENVIGQVYFYYSDVGVFGIMYALGLLGVFIFLLQIRFVWSFLKRKQIDYFFFCIVLTLIYMMVYTILTGQSIHNFQIYVFMISFIYLMKDNSKCDINFHDKK